MTFSNRREPNFGGPQSEPPAASPQGPHVSSSDALAHKVAKASGLTRMVSSVQIIGSLLAVPLGLASGYSMYKANFAADTTCQNLRANIVAMLDKNVDPATRRMLVRRDITTFEQSCGGFDPDAQAAFKTLLAVPNAPAVATATPAAAVPTPKLRPAVPATEVARKDVKPEPKMEAAKVEPKPEPKVDVAKAEPKPDVKPATASIQSIEREAAVSDTRWLDAVRSALVNNNPEAAQPAKAEPAKLEPRAVEAKASESKPVDIRTIENILAEPAAKPARHEAVAVAKPATAPVQLQPTWNVAPSATPAIAAQTQAPDTAVAPALGAPTEVPPTVAIAPVPPAPATDTQSRILNVTTVRDDAPRPPAAINGPAPINGPTEGDDSTKSRIGSWIAQIPLVGRVIEPRE